MQGVGTGRRWPAGSAQLQLLQSGRGKDLVGGWTLWQRRDQGQECVEGEQRRSSMVVKMSQEQDVPTV